MTNNELYFKQLENVNGGLIDSMITVHRHLGSMVRMDAREFENADTPDLDTFIAEMHVAGPLGNDSDWITPYPVREDIRVKL
jgi:hypothetical protein